MYLDASKERILEEYNKKYKFDAALYIKVKATIEIMFLGWGVFIQQY